MGVDSTRNYIENVVEWLKGDDEADWDGRIGDLNEALGELRDMAKPLYDASKNPSPKCIGTFLLTRLQKAHGAIPRVEAMLSEMRNRDRAKALARAAEAIQALAPGDPNYRERWVRGDQVQAEIDRQKLEEFDLETKFEDAWFSRPTETFVLAFRRKTGG